MLAELLLLSGPPRPFWLLRRLGDSHLLSWQTPKALLTSKPPPASQPHQHLLPSASPLPQQHHYPQQASGFPRHMLAELLLLSGPPRPVWLPHRPLLLRAPPRFPQLLCRPPQQGLWLHQQPPLPSVSPQLWQPHEPSALLLPSGMQFPP